MRGDADLTVGLAVVLGIAAAVKGKKSYRVGKPATKPPTDPRQYLTRSRDGREYVDSSKGRRNVVRHADGRVELARKTTKPERKAARKCAKKSGPRSPQSK